MSAEAKEVFISYAHRDFRLVLDIVVKLEELGCKVWFDEDDIQGGDGWQDKIREAIYGTNACAVFIGEKEPETWHKEEMELALNRRANDKKQEFVVIPVLLDTKNFDEVKAYLSTTPLGLKSVITFKHPDPLWPLFRLWCAIKRERAERNKFLKGAWPGASLVKKEVATEVDPFQQHLERINRLKDGGVIDEETYREHVKKVLDRSLDEDLKRATPHAS
jgi:TIR domain-containing protein